MIGLQVDPWVVGAFVTINLAAFTAVGGVVWALLRDVTEIKTALNGTSGDQGFIDETSSKQNELAKSQDELGTQIRVQGHLLNEVAYASAELAKHVDNETDAGVDARRLEEAHERARHYRDQWSSEEDE